ncbi:gliding motility-associated C-terminal domain-containing protein [Flavobacterium kingsejongi]|uniref:Ig-like domain-containing protein n=1 Tax=Flavobacterium kingsejongi TaxID=1678728 RepID=A0A2S1LSM4_9FLAO|nr:gliding motility-associated C-terminal domain-containing protein [Flavobacterium kingsejongi]AWG26763.1 hypothetical protein FK004_16765 [Flavobacterium kingsejongi]
MLALGVANNIDIVSVTETGEQVVSLNSLLNVDLLGLLQGGQEAVIPFIPSSPTSRIRVSYRSLLNINLTQRLDLYGITRTPGAPVINPASLNPVVCSGQSASIIAATNSTSQLRWYTTPTGGSAIGLPLGSGATFITPALTQTTTYYVSATTIGCTLESPRVPVTVTVITLPVASDITIPATVAACNGEVTLVPQTSLQNPTFHYYTDQLKTTEILTGYPGNPGITYVKDATTGTLAISGLTAVNTPQTYYVAVSTNGSCENATNTLAPVTVNYLAPVALTVNANLAACGSADLASAILSLDTSGTTIYTFYNASNVLIPTQDVTTITTSGTYYIQASNASGICSSQRLAVAVTVNPLPTLTVPTNSFVTNVGSTVTIAATSNGTLAFYNSSGALVGSNTVGPFPTAGIYTYTIIATLGTCTVTENVTVTVVDPTSCFPLSKRNFATTQTDGTIITGGVMNGGNAVDQNMQTYSTVTTGVGLLGIGTTWQTLQWPQTIPAGTPVTIKLGSEYSLLTLLGGYSVVGTKRNGSGTPVEIGPIQSISGSLLNLLPGQNSFEVTFVPSNNTGPKAYDGVRIVIGSVLSVAQSVKVYDAYYTEVATSIACQNDIDDVLSGVVDLGVGAATATVNVFDPFNAIDGNTATFAKMTCGVGVLAAAQMDFSFATPSVPNDVVKIIVSKNATLLSLGLLSGFTIQKFLGDTPVGAPIDNSSNLLTLSLLGGGAQAQLLVNSGTAPFDRIRIRIGGVAAVLNELNVHEVSRAAIIKINNNSDTINACINEVVTLAAPADNCTTYVWYDAETAGNILSTGASFTIPASYAAGTYTFYIQPVRYGCQSFSRTPVKVIVGANAPANAISTITINGATATQICAPTGAVALAVQLATTPVLTAPIFEWYSYDGTIMTLVPGQTAATLPLTGLIPGTYTYYVGVRSNEYCPTAAEDRKPVTFTLLPFSIASDITIDPVAICLNNDAALTPNSTLVDPVYTYYLSNDSTQPITSGQTINNALYTITDGTLSISGLSATNSPYTLYIAVASTTTCTNLDGTLKAVTITVNNTATPTTNNTTQQFCATTLPTVANIQVNETGVVFYDAATGGAVVTPTTALVNGTIYYASLTDPTTNCESSIRLAVTVNVNDAATPSTNNATQQFCASTLPTVANIQVNETGVVFYDAATGGNIITPTTALVNGTIYYASLTDPTTNCESSVRLAVTVNVNDAATPTTNNATQQFCASTLPTVANIQVNEAGVVFYDAATGGNIVAPTSALVNGMIYYASLTDPTTNCESSIRLAVTVNVNDAATPTTNNATQQFCASTLPTVANIQVNEAGVVFYDAATAGNIIAPTTALVNGTIYYASLTDPTTNCESSVRLAVTVNVNDAATPTTNNATQQFCASTLPTVANIQVNEAGVVFYDAATAGNIIAPTTALVNGTIYYASLTDPTTNCESSVRLAITVNVNDAATPTTNNATQQFCASTLPTVANIQVNEAGVVFYDAATGGNIVTPTTALVNGTTYYASVINTETNCESSVRLAITVNVNDAATPTTNNATQQFCASTLPTVANIQVNETGVVFYDAATGGNIVAPTSALVNGTIYYASLTNSETNCESSVRLAITVNVNDAATPTTNNATQQFCASTLPTVANIQVNETGVVFYDAATGGNIIAPTTALVNGTIYYASLTNTETNCESSVRLAVTVNVNDAATPTTNNATQQFCANTLPTVANIQVNETGVVFYDAATGGNIVTPTTALVNGTTYYASVINTETNCQSSVRLAVTVNVNDAATPTTNNATQQFCASTLPTVANIQVNETGVIFYDAATGGNIIASTTALVNGNIYYASLTNTETNCQSSVRLAVTVNVNDAATPTTNNATQQFCASTLPTVANIQVNETGVVFYDAATGGNIVTPTTALVNGTIYYASLTDPTTNCESSVRLAITVNVNDAATPTSNSTTQQFCASTLPTVANIQVNETGVVFYDAATGGNIITPTTALVNGTIYYASLTDPTTNCESSIRLAVTVNVNDAATPTTNNATQQFCASTLPTVANIQVNETGVVFYDVATGGNIVTPTTALVNGSTYYASLTNTETNCQSSVRLAITVNVNDAATPTTNNATQQFCASTLPTVANIQVNETGVVFYDAATGGNIVAPTTPLVNGTIYYASLTDPTTNCESSVRLAITVNVNDVATPTTNNTTQQFCASTLPTVTNIQINETGVVFYDAATGGNIVTPTTALVNGSTYYASLTNTETNCQSSVRLAITVNVNNAATPTTNNLAQQFCASTLPTVANIQVNETGVVFYDAATSGNIVAPTTALTNGSTYYASLTNTETNCQSSVRLAITVTINNAATPTTNNLTQQFCANTLPTVANIQVNETGVVFYDAATGGNIVAPTTALVNGATYYASQVLGTCESTIRLAITVTVSNVPTPTTNDLTQEFCAVDNPTVADIQVNETGVIFYTAASGGTVVTPGTALVSGTTYYVSLTNGNCESAVRLAISVLINNAPTPTATNLTQQFCSANNATVSSIQVNEPGVVFYTAATGGTIIPPATALVNGTIYYASLTNPNTGCESSIRLAISVALTGGSTLAAISSTDDSNVCVFEDVTYTTAPGMTGYIWTITNGTITAGGTATDNYVTVSWENVGPGSVNLSYQNSGVCNTISSGSVEVAVTSCSDLTITKTVDNPTPMIDDNVVFTITVNNIGLGELTAIVVNEHLPSGYQFISATASHGSYNNLSGLWNIPALAANTSATLSVTVKVLLQGEYLNVASVESSNPIDANPNNNIAEATIEPLCLIVYNEFSPNNDGQNDLFRIDCIEKYPNNKLEVYNRYGSLVYKVNSYKNEWDGTANVNSPVATDKLAAGTYYYVLDTGTNIIKKGWLYITR